MLQVGRSKVIFFVSFERKQPLSLQRQRGKEREKQNKTKQKLSWCEIKLFMTSVNVAFPEENSET